MRTRVTNGAMEAINGLLQLAKRLARGYRSIRTFRIMAYLKAGKLQLEVPSFRPLPTHSKQRRAIFSELTTILGARRQPLSNQPRIPLPTKSKFTFSSLFLIWRAFQAFPWSCYS